MNDSGMLKPALIGGVLLGILSAVPVLGAVNCICCAWVIAGGMLAAYLHVKASPDAVTLGGGVILGMITGAIGAVVDTLFSIPLHILMTGFGMDVFGQLEEVLERIPEIPAQQRETLRAIFADRTGAGIFLMVIGGIFTLVVFSIMGMAGGAIGVAIFEKRKPGQATPGPVSSPSGDDLPPPIPPSDGGLR